MSQETSVAGTVTLLLRQIGSGNSAAEQELLTLVYDDLRRQAAHHLKKVRDPSLDATGLAHEICRRMLDRKQARIEDRRHFFRLTSRIMRHFLIDRARANNALKRDGRLQRRSLVEVTAGRQTLQFDILDLNHALQELEDQNPEAAELVQLRFFGGCTLEEAAESLGCPYARVRSTWTYARAWLHERLSRGRSDILPIKK